MISWGGRGGGRARGGYQALRYCNTVNERLKALTLYNFLFSTGLWTNTGEGLISGGGEGRAEEEGTYQRNKKLWLEVVTNGIICC